MPRRVGIEFRHSGKVGDTAVVEYSVEVAFRGEMIVVTDSRDGEGTRFRPSIANKHQGGGGFFLTKDHPPNNLDCGILMDVAQIGDIVKFEVEFLKDCDWSAFLVGSKVGDSKIVDEKVESK